jgi:hypothetical protein
MEFGTISLAFRIIPYRRDFQKGRRIYDTYLFLYRKNRLGGNLYSLISASATVGAVWAFMRLNILSGHAYCKQMPVGSLTVWLMLLKDFGLYKVIFVNVYIVLIVAMVMLLRDFLGPDTGLTSRHRAAVCQTEKSLQPIARHYL